MSRTVTKDNLKELNNIRNNYPETWAWMEHKANWEQMSMSAVLLNYRKHIKELKQTEYIVREVEENEQ
jgi:hypothetical protein